MIRGAHIVTRDLTLGYAAPASKPAPRPEPRPVVEQLQLTVAPGERIVLVGASGCGKTTLLNALAGLLTPLSGEVIVDGMVVASSQQGCSSRHAAYMFQRDLLLPWATALENAILPASIARPRVSRRDGAGRSGDLRERATRLLAEFGLGGALEAYPHQLSGGMRQRVALARTLLLERRLVLLDEPFAGLDALTRAELQEWLRRVMFDHAATWVLVTHDVHEAAVLADRVAVLDSRATGIAGWVHPAHCDAPETEIARLLAEARGLG